MLFLALLLFAMVKPPALPYYDWGVCPFEGCAYREWTALRPIVVYDSWKAGRKVAGRLEKGEKVVGVRGVVITFRPGIVVAQRDIPADGVRRGDRILTYSYAGEGNSLAWRNGRFDVMDVATAEIPEAGCPNGGCVDIEIAGKKEWWAEIRWQSGRTGWVLMEGKPMFNGVDRLG